MTAHERITQAFMDFTRGSSGRGWPVLIGLGSQLHAEFIGEMSTRPKPIDAALVFTSAHVYKREDLGPDEFSMAFTVTVNEGSEP